MSDPIHMEEVRKAATKPLHQKLVDVFVDMVRDPEKGVADYATGLKAVLEEDLIEGSDAVSGPHD